MASGTIKRLIREKGFGFIEDLQSGAELFFHRSSVKGAMFEDLQEGTRVVFDEGQSQKGPRAENVRAA